MIKASRIPAGKEGGRKRGKLPVRCVAVAASAVLEAAAIIAAVIAICCLFPQLFALTWAVQAVCAVRIISSDDNPDYKLPWLLFVLALPVVGFTLYALFYSRRLKPRYVRRLLVTERSYVYDDSAAQEELKATDRTAYSQARMLCGISGSRLFKNTSTEFFALGERLFESLKTDLRRARQFIFLEYFIIKEGALWTELLSILRDRAAVGVEVRLVYDDLGCMFTLPEDYPEILAGQGITAVPFSRLRLWADGEINNRNHRKIAVIDGCIAYTGGVNVADEYANLMPRFGHWKDGGIRLAGPAVWELTRLFLTDFDMNVKDHYAYCGRFYPDCDGDGRGFAVPYGDGPRPVFRYNVSKLVIQNVLAAAERYAYFTSPYLIIDNELCKSFENAAMRGVDVRIILPRVPDKRLIFSITRSFYARLIAAGVQIYEYTPGFMHAKNCVCDGRYAIIGTANLDYRSLAHHFENGVWLYRADCIKDVLADMQDVLEKSEKVPENTQTPRFFVRIGRAIARIFAPLL